MPEEVKNETGIWIKVGSNKWKIKEIHSLPLLEKRLADKGKALEDVQYESKGKERGQGRSLPPDKYYEKLEELYPGRGWKERGEENKLRRFARSIRESLHKHEREVMQEEQAQRI